jgi:hypothetical protein
MRAVLVAVASVVALGFLSIPAAAHADPSCVNGTVRGGPGFDVFLCQGGGWLHVIPTSDSLDQAPPPRCVRFPDKYMCPADPDEPPPGLQWVTPGHWFPGSGY